MVFLINQFLSQTQAGKVLLHTRVLLLLIFPVAAPPSGAAQETEPRPKEVGMTRAEAAERARTAGFSAEEIQALQGKALPPGTSETGGERRDSVLVPQAVDSATFIPAPAPPPVGRHGLEYFGYALFSRVPKAFEPSASGPVDPDYLIGPDDVVRVSVWGQVELQSELTVDREGRVFLPTVGQVMLSGLSLREATEKLKGQMSRSYSGLVARPPTVWLDLTLARLRPKRVFILGEVNLPGAYTVGSYATVFNSLFAVGGPGVNGSMREVRVLRGEKVIARVDLYGYLAGLDSTGDLRIQNNDIIFVPVRGKTVSIRGEVRRPALYELKAGEGLGNLLKLAGGLLPTASGVTAQVDRITPMEQRTGGVDDRLVVDIPLEEFLSGRGRADGTLHDGDDVRVFTVLDELRNYVTIEGSVWRPGRYELSRVRTVRELVAAAGGVQPRTYMAFSHLTRLNPDLMTRRILSFNLETILSSPAEDIALQQRDHITVYSSEIIEIKDLFVTIRGSVKSPGRYPLSTRMTLEDLIPLAGGYTEDVELLEAEVSRIRLSGLHGDTLAVILHPSLPTEFSPVGQPWGTGAVGGDTTRAAQFLLHHRDEILVKANPYYITQKNVFIGGDITYPGVYSLKRRGERLSEILKRAGGPTITSYLGGAEFYRNGERLLLDFTRAYERGDERHDVIMLDRDSLYIPSRPHTVLVSGEVNNPGFLSFNEGESVREYIDRAGGLTDSASYAVLIQPTGESRRVNFGWFSADPEVAEGSAIQVLRIPAPVPDTRTTDVAGTIKDVFAIVTSAATLAFIIWQVNQ